jgi:biopolymer transport protein ExbB
MKNSLLVSAALVLTLMFTASVAAAPLDDLLRQVRQGKIGEAKENAQREQQFQRDKSRQAQLLQNAKDQRARQEVRSSELENVFDENELRIADLQEQYIKRLGSLKELFGVLQQAAGDARGTFDASLTNIQYPDRGEFLTSLAEKMGSATKLPSIEEIERLWFEMQREMTETGKVSKFTAKVVTVAGDEIDKELIRVGAFNVVSGGQFLQYEPTTRKVVELSRQPQDRFLKSALALQSAGSGFTPFGVDPSRGVILGLLVQAPTFIERLEQGGVIGYIIMGLGAIAVLIAVVRYVWLLLVGIQVSSQRKSPDKPNVGNPLGRVLKAYHDNRSVDVETLELKLGEAILKETPRLTRWNMMLKVIAVVAPLMGLLGTVTGMIITFQAITLFGTGDPKIMAGGISQALMTTVQGLCVAIPTVLLHTLVSGRSTRIIQVLEEQTAGMVAEQSEKAHGGGGPAAAAA